MSAVYFEKGKPQKYAGFTLIRKRVSRAWYKTDSTGYDRVDRLSYPIRWVVEEREPKIWEQEYDATFASKGDAIFWCDNNAKRGGKCNAAI